MSEDRHRAHAPFSRARRWLTRAAALRLDLPGARGQRGVTFLFTTVSFVTLFGMVGLGTEVGNWYFAKRQSQNAADAAALAGVMALSANGLTCPSQSSPGTQTAKSAATYVTGQNGFPGPTVNCPPQSGSNTSNGNAVEVYVTENVTPVFASFFIGNVEIASRAVAALTPSPCNVDPGGDINGGSSGTNFVLSNGEKWPLPQQDYNGATIHVSGWGTVQFTHDANGATLIIDSSCVGTDTLGHDFNGSHFTDNYVPTGMNNVYVVHNCNNCTATNGDVILGSDPDPGSDAVFDIGHDANGSSFTFKPCPICTTTGGSSGYALVE